MIYELLEADTAEDLEIKINQKLVDGWELYGNLVTATKIMISPAFEFRTYAVE